MGKATLWVVGGFLGIAVAAAGMLGAMLSVQGSDGRSGWDAALGRSAPPPKETPEQIRKRSMPKLTITGPTNPRGCSTFLPGETIRFSVVANSQDPAGADELAVIVYQDGSVDGSLNFFGPTWPAAAQTYDITSPSSSSTAIRFRAPATYLGEGTYTYEDHDYTVPVDTTTEPSFPSFTYDVDDCDPLTFTARITVNRADSWSYRLLDDEGQEVSGGTPNTPDTSGCSFQVVVSGITGAAQIEITATNPNGSTTQAFTLAVPASPSVSLNAVPTGVEQGNSSTLTWSTSGALVVSIDNGVGTVAPSGSTTVTPIETTTYTITAEGACDTATAQVTVYVQGAPLLPSATMRLIAQTGLASEKTATLPTSAQMRLMAQDLDRRPHRKVSLCRINALEEVRTSHRKASLCRIDARAQKSKVSLCRIDARATHRKASLCRVIALLADRYHVYARNTSTGVVTELGAIEGDAATKTLTGVSLASGTYEIWTTHDSTLFAGARRSAVQVVTIGDDGPVVDPLPAVVGLASSIRRGLTTITWGISHPLSSWGMEFGLWYSETSPVATFTTPVETVSASKVRASFEATRRQAGAEYVAVALIGADGSLGPAAELLLPWGEAPASPVNQTAGA
jgi:hypothetical protein